MAANFARCRSRAIQSLAAVLKQNSRNSTQLSCKTNANGAGMLTTKRCAFLTARLPTQPSRESLVQAVSRNFSVLPNQGAFQTVTVTPCGMGAIVINHSSGSMDECCEESEDEATSGRKRIKPYELERDDP